MGEGRRSKRAIADEAASRSRFNGIPLHITGQLFRPDFPAQS